MSRRMKTNNYPPQIMISASPNVRRCLLAIVEHRQAQEDEITTREPEEITMSSVIRALIREEVARKKLSISGD